MEAESDSLEARAGVPVAGAVTDAADVVFTFLKGADRRELENARKAFNEFERLVHLLRNGRPTPAERDDLFARLNTVFLEVNPLLNNGGRERLRALLATMRGGSIAKLNKYKDLVTAVNQPYVEPRRRR